MYPVLLHSCLYLFCMMVPYSSSASLQTHARLLIKQNMDDPQLVSEASDTGSKAMHSIEPVSHPVGAEAGSRKLSKRFLKCFCGYPAVDGATGARSVEATASKSRLPEVESTKISPGSSYKGRPRELIPKSGGRSRSEKERPGSVDLDPEKEDESMDGQDVNFRFVIDSLTPEQEQAAINWVQSQNKFRKLDHQNGFFYPPRYQVYGKHVDAQFPPGYQEGYARYR
ncbi:hypothetical protein PGTUg99_009075 [Puccinia graminis f. sp. tritici]|uniref:Uncharacterized protein n=1 Tax=Puccinia graminis f. sp. tritici TaxID=56615 RepID=A0A5B0RVS8_PUCGR|nr:hypothetical protein PGTUg99_009075 [Puccinia graminis f. sp. tritici]